MSHKIGSRNVSENQFQCNTGLIVRNLLLTVILKHPVNLAMAGFTLGKSLILCQLCDECLVLRVNPQSATKLGNQKLLFSKYLPNVKIYISDINLRGVSLASDFGFISLINGIPLFLGKTPGCARLKLVPLTTLPRKPFNARKVQVKSFLPCPTMICGWR